MMLMGKLEARHRLTVVRRLCGQLSIGPRGVDAQSFDRTSFAISEPPDRKLSDDETTEGSARREASFISDAFYIHFALSATPTDILFRRQTRSANKAKLKKFDPTVALFASRICNSVRSGSPLLLVKADEAKGR